MRILLSRCLMLGLALIMVGNCLFAQVTLLPLAENPNTEIQYGSQFTIGMELNMTSWTPGEWLEIKLPDNFSYSSSSFEWTSQTNVYPVFDESGSDDRTIRLTMANPTGAGTYDIHGLMAPSCIANTQSTSIEAQFHDENGPSGPISYLNVNLIGETNLTFYDIDIDTENECTGAVLTDDIYEYRFRISKPLNLSLQTAQIEIDVDGASLTPLGFARIDGNDEHALVSQTMPPTAPNAGTFVETGIVGGNYGDEYVAYFRVDAAEEGLLSFTPKLRITNGIDGCSNPFSTDWQTMETVEHNVCPEPYLQGGSNKIDLDFDMPEKTCAGDCSSKDFRFEVKNSHSPTGFAVTPLDVFISIPEGVTLDRIFQYNRDVEHNQENVEIRYSESIVTNNSTYFDDWSSGPIGVVNKTSSSTYYFPEDPDPSNTGGIRTVGLRFESFDARSTSVFRVYFESDPSITGNLEISGSIWQGSGNGLKKQESDLFEFGEGAECRNIRLRDHYDKTGVFERGIVVDLHEEFGVINELYMLNQGGEDNSFGYTTTLGKHEYIEGSLVVFYGDPITYIGQSFAQVTQNFLDFEDVAGLQALDQQMLANYVLPVIDAEAGTITFDGIGLSGAGCDPNKRFYAAWRAKVSPNALSGGGNLSYTALAEDVQNGDILSGFDLYYPRGTISIIESSGINTSVLVGCAEEAVGSELQIGATREIFYQIQVQSGGSEPLGQFDLFGAFPHTGTLAGQEFLGSNSTEDFDLELVSVSMKDYTTPSIEPGGKVQVRFSSSPTCLPSDLTQCSPISQQWSEGASYGSGAKAIWINNVDGYSLTPSTVITVVVKAQIPATYSIGNSAMINLITTGVTANNGYPIGPEISDPAIITIVAAGSGFCDPPPPPCPDCLPSFQPYPGEQYVLSAWIKETRTDGEPVAEFTDGRIEISYGTAEEVHVFEPAGQIIDGWQRVERAFTIPSDGTEIIIELVGSANNPTYFDDIRVHPFNGNMKSFVYDPVNLRLMAELDENNYTTFYEYDEEGALVRIKKETERGIKTIQETRNHSSITE